MVFLEVTNMAASLSEQTDDTAVLAARGELAMALAELVAEGTDWLNRLCGWQRLVEGGPGLLTGSQVEQARDECAVSGVTLALAPSGWRSLEITVLRADIALSQYKRVVERLAEQVSA